MHRETLSKRTMTERIAAKAGIPIHLAQEVIQDFLDLIVAELSQGHRIEFRDFGVFQTVTRKPRTALNPRTLEKVPVSSRVVVKFKAGRMLRERVEHPPGGSAPAAPLAATDGAPTAGEAGPGPGGDAPAAGPSPS
jgi:integration host factor subunit beta